MQKVKNILVVSLLMPFVLCGGQESAEVLVQAQYPVVAQTTQDIAKELQNAVNALNIERDYLKERAKEAEALVRELAEANKQQEARINELQEQLEKRDEDKERFERFYARYAMIAGVIVCVHLLVRARLQDDCSEEIKRLMTIMDKLIAEGKQDANVAGDAAAKAA